MTRGKLGFGLMRLPKLENGEIDVEQVKVMVDMFLDAGMTYFDTAYVYDDGKSEEAARKALVERHPRDSYTIATKLNARVASDMESAKAQFRISLERLGCGYIDYYLLHALGKGNIDAYDEYGIWDYVKEQKELGLVKHWGFSFHDSPEFLDELLTKHPDAEFVQLQINYADWENEKVRSRECYEVARRHGKMITVMEPVKGGKLANPVDSIREIFEEARPGMSPASWAIRFVASQEGLLAVLSGMSNIEQMRDNLSYMKDFEPFTENDYEVIKKAQEILNGIPSIPCTACRYCTEGCPMGIPIPNIFDARNTQLIWNQQEAGRRQYERATRDKGKASDCIQCGQCEGACPQHLNVIELLQECAANLE